MSNCGREPDRSALYKLSRPGPLSFMVFQLNASIVEDDVVIVTVLAVGKRDRSEVYSKAMDRLQFIFTCHS